MRKDATEPKCWNARSHRCGRDNADPERFCTEWYMAEDETAAEFLKDDAADSVPQVRGLLLDLTAGRGLLERDSTWGRQPDVARQSAMQRASHSTARHG
jgi:hypothetical protein